MLAWPEAFSVNGVDFYCISGANSYSAGLQPLVVDSLNNSPDQFGLNVSRRFFRFPFAGLGRYQIIVRSASLRRAMVMKFYRPLEATIEENNVPNFSSYFRDSCFLMEFDVDSEGFGVLVEYDCGTEIFIATLNILLLDKARLSSLECW